MGARSFSHGTAARRPDPVLLGISGPSSSGKTKTALRLAQGLVSVSGGEIFGVDTEQGRMAKYAPELGQEARPPHTFAFKHVLFDPPYNPKSYIDAIEHCTRAGAGCIIIDSTSHEHEGAGGRIDSADKEAQRRAERWNCSIDKVKFGSFAPNSAERNEFRFALGRRKCHIILCFRAKESNAQEGKDIVDLGFTPIGADAFVWELDSSILLLPHAAGVPTWKSTKKGENLCLKCDDTHKGILDSEKQLTEAHGAQLARASGWKLGGATTSDRSRAASSPPAKSSSIGDAAPGGAGESPQSAPPNTSDDGFPGDRPAPDPYAPHPEQRGYNGATYDPGVPRAIAPKVAIMSAESADLKAWAATLRDMIEHAGDDSVRRQWNAENAADLLRLSNRSKPLYGWALQFMPIDSAGPQPVDGDAPEPVGGADADGGRVAASTTGAP